MSSLCRDSNRTIPDLQKSITAVVVSDIQSKKGHCTSPPFRSADLPALSGKLTFDQVLFLWGERGKPSVKTKKERLITGCIKEIVQQETPNPQTPF